MACQYYWGGRGGGGRERTNEPELHILFLRFNSFACIYISLCGYLVINTVCIVRPPVVQFHHAIRRGIYGSATRAVYSTL